MSSSFACSSRALARRGATSCLGLCLGLLLLACRTVDGGTSLRIEVPEADRDADLCVDGHYVGQVGAVGKEPVGPVMLAPGVHRVEVRKPGRFPVQRTVRVDRETPAETILEAELLEDPQ
jgi:hypothetical protein